MRIASRRRDDTLRDPVIVWSVRHGDNVNFRSVTGRDAAWFRGVLTRHEGQVSANGVEKDVSFVETNDVNDELDAAYSTRYRQYPGIITSPDAQAATLKIPPVEA